MTRVRISTTVDGDRLAQARKLSGMTDSRLMDRALADLVENLEAEREIASLKRHPYEADGDLSWQETPPSLPYDGQVPDEVVQLARERRPRRRKS